MIPHDPHVRDVSLLCIDHIHVDWASKNRLLHLAQNRALSLLVSLQEKSLLRACLVSWQEETAAVQETVGKQQR